MSRKTFLMLLFIFSLLSVPAITLHANATDSYFEDFEIHHVEHVVQIQDGGVVIIKDIVNVSLAEESSEPRKFPIGFPFEYAPNLAYCFAHNTLNPAEVLEVTRDTGLGRIGFYGIAVTLPVDKNTYSFTVVFVFSDLIRAETPELDYYWWNVTFPIYPSLTQTTPICNTKVILPPNVGNFTVEHHSNLVEKGLNVSTTFTESHQTLQFSRSSLEDFARESAWLRFYQFSPSELDVFLMIDADEAKRDVTLDEWGHIFVSDFYHLTNKGEWNLTNAKLRLPQYAFDISWIDEAGKIHEELSLEGNATTPHVNATISFGAVKKNEDIEFTINYRLPWKEYVIQNGWRNYGLAFSLFEHEYFDWVIKKLSVTIKLPRNANFQSCSVPPQSVGEDIIFALHNVTTFHNLDFHLTYEYTIFWASFYPTLWVGISAIVILIIAFLWRAPKPTPVPVIPVSPKALRHFVETYEKKTSAIGELEILEEQLRKRKISRRRYKVRKKALEGRLSTLSKDLTELKEELRKAGSRYADIMRQVEVAETELEETEAAIRRIELRYRRREISKGTYNKLLEEYNHRKERAETTIDGVLLRLREELR
ncbi:MAG: hypothetical protein ACE5L6_01160 [Candidatus Bathyarchaeia archaeon]